MENSSSNLANQRNRLSYLPGHFTKQIRGINGKILLFEFYDLYFYKNSYNKNYSLVFFILLSLSEESLDEVQFPSIRFPKGTHCTKAS